MCIFKHIPVFLFFIIRILVCISIRRLALIFALSFPCNSWAQNELSAEYGSGNSPVLSFYQNNISEARGVSCPMYPSCSQYAKLAFKEYTPLHAVALTADRLIRCGHDLKQYESIPLEAGSFYFDPLPDTTLRVAHYQNFVKPVFRDSSFIDFLISKQRFQEARLELWRGIYETKEPTAKPALYFTIGKTYYLNKEYEGLFKFYAENTSAFSLNQYSDSVKVLLTKAYLYSGKYQAAQVAVNSLRTAHHNADEVAFLQGLVALHQRDIEKCEREMKSIASGTKYFAHANNFIGITQEFASLKRRSPNAASLMSVVVPGSGYLVAGKKGTALTALLINGLFAFIAVEAFQNKNNALGIGTAVLGSGWYMGSVIGAHNAVVKWNNTQKENFIKQKTLRINLN
ncbi:MAG: membrane protein insertion efficiency factor YidD [Cytophagia bacterium]|nr:membrane protein insertion efficiency factor YidD [Cytophagia bacterium]